jgi:hypothetical protein
MTYAEIREMRLVLTDTLSRRETEGDQLAIETVETRTYTSDVNPARASGVVFQRCGGGVRILRKRIGGGTY